MCRINARLPLVASWVPFLERVFFCNMWVQHTTYVAGCNIPHVDHAGTRGGGGQDTDEGVRGGHEVNKGEWGNGRIAHHR